MLSLWRHPYVRILFVALVLRVLWALLVPVVPISDGYAYDTFARNLASGLGYGWSPERLTAYWPVGTSFVYSILYMLFGHTYKPIVVLHIFLGLITILFSMLLAERWFNRGVAIVTGLLLATWPSQIQFSTVLASEPLFIALLVASLWVWTTPAVNFWVQTVLVGTLLGAATYVRPTALLVPVLLALATIAKERQWVRPLAAAAVVFLVIGALNVPWGIRNARVFGSFVLTTNGGATLWMGNNPYSLGSYMEYPEHLKTMNEAEIDKYLGATAKSHILRYPGQFVGRTLVKLVRLHDRETIGVHWNEGGLTGRFGARVQWVLKFVSTGFWLVTVALAVIGVAFLLVARGVLMALAQLPVLIWAYFALLHAMILVNDRYHFPSIPMIAMLAAFAITTIGERLRSQSARSEHRPDSANKARVRTDGRVFGCNSATERLTALRRGSRPTA